MLVQFRSNDSSTSPIVSELELFPEIMEGGIIQFGKHDIVDDTGFIYGEAQGRTDLTWKQVNDLKKAVRSMVQGTIPFPSNEIKPTPIFFYNRTASRPHPRERIPREPRGRTECDVSAISRKSDADSWWSRKAPSSRQWRNPESTPAWQKIETTPSLVTPI